jgi:hypothetical protein
MSDLLVVMGLGLLTTGRAGGFQGGSSVQFGVNLVNDDRLAGNFVACHEKKSKISAWPRSDFIYWWGTQ